MMFSDKPLEQQEQWQVESNLGNLISQLHTTRHSAEDYERRSRVEREEEAKLLAEISRHRHQLGISDSPIVTPGLQANGDQATPGEQGTPKVAPELLDKHQTGA